jgi:2,4-dienoyl-CoA reductase-like NADH-dependent reductase (Old Yellow Enzyme family)
VLARWKEGKMSDQVRFDKMLEPFKMRDLEIKNRLAMAPLHTAFTPTAHVTEQLISYLAERARNGVGLIVTSPVSGVAIPGMPQPPLFNSPVQMPGWNELIETIHAFGAKVFLQLMPGVGRQARRGLATKAPSPIPLRIPPENLPRKSEEFAERKKLPSIWVPLMETEPPQEMTIDEIGMAEDAYSVAGRMAKMCGADGAELHFAHGYLGYSFLSPRTNQRDDAYGGSFENRVRFLTNVLAKVRREVGDSFVVGIRISGDEHMPGGLGVEETGEILRTAEGMGLDYVHLTDGCFEAAKWYVPDEDGTMLVEAEVLKRMLKIPVITPSIHDPVAAEEALRAGKTDMVSLGRALLADSAWADKVRRGQHSKIVKCIRCLTCLRRTRSGLPIRCEVNPRLGAERYDPANHRLNAPHKRVFHYPGA